MDMISKSAFAIDVDAQRDQQSPFIKFAKDIFGVKMTDPKAILLCTLPLLLFYKRPQVSHYLLDDNFVLKGEHWSPLVKTIDRKIFLIACDWVVENHIKFSY